MRKRRGIGLISPVTMTLLILFVQGGAVSTAQATSPSDLPLTAPYAGWEEVGAGSASGGGISDNAGVSVYPSLAISPDGTPYVAWEDWSDGDYEIYVRRWNGKSWEEVGSGSTSGGGISNNRGDSSGPALAVAPDGTPYAAWSDTSGGKWAVYVRRWNGSAWEEVGAGSASGGGISGHTGYLMRLALAIAPDGTPYVAWEDPRSGNYEIYIRHWNGTAWEEVGTGSASGGGISHNDSRSRFPTLAVAPDGSPYVTWEDVRGGSLAIADIYVRRWNGSVWQEMGAASASGGGVSNSGSAYDPTLAITSDGTPYVAWCDESGGEGEIYVRRWDGVRWEEAGDGAASGGGISDNSGRSVDPWLAVAPDGAPYVAWEDYADGDYEIYVRRWNGKDWEEVGDGAANGGGISDNGDWSTSPSLAVAADGTFFAAWDDNTSGNDEIYVRHWKSYHSSHDTTQVFLPITLVATSGS